LCESYQIDFVCNESVLELSPESIKNKIVPVLVTTILQAYFKQIFPRPNIITSERTGISFFYEKLKPLRGTFQTSTTIDDKIVYQILNKENYEHIESALYQQAVLDNITLLGELINSSKSSYFADNKNLEITQFIEKEINRGSYEILQPGGALADKKLQFKLHGGNAIEINAASSSIKSLILLDLYLKKMAQPGDLLIIDEPELNLHPSNQRKIARLLAMLANNDIKVMFTTHSDYLMNEINNLIKLGELSSEAQNKILAKYKLTQSALINKENISANYIKRTKNGCVLAQCEVIDGVFEYKTFDDEISNLNNFVDEIQDLYIAETNAKFGSDS
jgi:predicted ATP-dependent endonuclease of OLD family